MGQLGHGDDEARNIPVLIESLVSKSITKIASGAGHCVVIDNHGVAYSWGASADF